MAEEGEGQDIFYLAEEALTKLKKKLADKAEITAEEVHELTSPENLADDAQMIPVDMRGVGQDFDDVEAMIEKLGATAAVEAFVKAREYFEANKDGEAAEDRPQPMTAAEWQALLNDDGMMEGEEEEMLMEGEEEELLADDEEPEEEGEEPPEKKAKTD
eukprot:CAMPEP_0169094754 /NCGR_PEP_ID=MMETSP1015-20121227/18114_1 /TAXON_ID=342587 /ORGANISM="Karlodinium micrum, Strain CCMP2283" /LENGTH=158 /DNA_ID=CAMNT_0009155433 /DNA_START=68 /DNA_END=544 /DNA_ORIENTATION=-